MSTTTPVSAKVGRTKAPPSTIFRTSVQNLSVSPDDLSFNGASLRPSPLAFGGFVGSLDSPHDSPASNVAGDLASDLASEENMGVVRLLPVISHSFQPGSFGGALDDLNRSFRHKMAAVVQENFDKDEEIRFLR